MGLRAKLFVLTILITSISLGSIILLEIDYIKKILVNFYNEEVLQESKSLLNKIDSNIDIAISQHSGAFTMLLNIPKSKIQSTAKRYVESNPNFHYLGIALSDITDQSGKNKIILDYNNLFQKIDSDRIISDSKNDLKTTITIDDRKYFLLTSSNIIDKRNKLTFITLYELNEIIPKTTWQNSKRAFVIDSKGMILSTLSESDNAIANRLVATELNDLKDQNGISAIREKKGKYIVSFSSSSMHPVSIVFWHSLNRIDQIIKKETLRQVSLVTLIIFVTILIAYFFANGFTKNIRKISDRMQLAAQGDMKSEIKLKTKDELGMLAKTFNWMIRNLHRLQLQEISFVRTENELETAKLIQSGLIPDERIVTNRTELSACYEAMTKCGGDWWSHFVIDDNYEYICVADATGHGPSAAIVTALAFSVFITVKEEIEKSGELIKPLCILERMNNLMAKDGLERITMTACIMLIDHDKQELQYANAGHLPILYFENSKLKSLLSPGTIVGVDSHPQFGVKNISIKNVTRIIATTDGLTEAMDPDGRMFGSKRLRNLLKQSNFASQKDLLDLLVNECKKFCKGQPAEDDFTVVVIDLLENTPKKDEKLLNNNILSNLEEACT